MQDEGYAPFRDPFLTLYFVQFASFAHFFCCIVLPYAPSTSMQVSGTYGQRLLFSIFAQPKRTCTLGERARVLEGILPPAVDGPSRVSPVRTAARGEREQRERAA